MSSSRKVTLILTSPPYLNKQTYTKDAWLRLWFLDRDRHEIAARALETGSIRLFTDRMSAMLQSMMKTLAPGGRIVLVNGRARAHFGKETETVCVADLCAYSAARVPGLELESVVRDERTMKRGSYFAVYASKMNGDGGRCGDEDILVLRKHRDA
jgi:tRNA G10  N-methylase Trm11